MTKKRHSDSVLSDLRDEWWSLDYLELVAKRLDLGECTTALDVGCGQGHWGHRILTLLHPEATLVGVDQEADWVTHATERADALGMSARCEFKKADAATLPFEDDSFDLVTCQTLVMHVSSPEIVLTEMLRVLKPGGRLLLAEPSNLPNQFSSDTLNRALSPEDLTDMAYLFVCCSRGRANLGRGDDSIADVLPELLIRLGVSDLRVFQNEKTSAVIPPYSDLVRGQLEEEMGHEKRGFWLWDRDDAYKLYVAGGGSAERFASAYAVFLGRSATFRAQVEAGTYSRVGGGHHYLFAARAPAPLLNSKV